MACYAAVPDVIEVLTPTRKRKGFHTCDTDEEDDRELRMQAKRSREFEQQTTILMNRVADLEAKNVELNSTISRLTKEATETKHQTEALLSVRSEMHLQEKQRREAAEAALVFASQTIERMSKLIQTKL